MHIPVLLEELVHAMNISPEGVYVDCTGGGGGHAAAVREKLTSGRLIVLDRDPQAVERLKTMFSGDSQIIVKQANFKDITEVLNDLDIDGVDGIYADFGVSSYQLSEGERGFSFKRDGILDMRMDPEKGESAKDVVNKYSEEQLGEIIIRYGDERFFKRVSRAIVSRRVIKPFTGTMDLASVVKASVPVKFHKHGLHPATQTFQALRIHVNQELVAIEYLLREFVNCLKKNGRAAFISFHSLEDRLVKEYFARLGSPCTCPPDFPVCVCGKTPLIKVLTKKPLIASEKEVKANPLSRSAKMRVAEKLV